MPVVIKRPYRIKGQSLRIDSQYHTVSLGSGICDENIIKSTKDIILNHVNFYTRALYTNNIDIKKYDLRDGINEQSLDPELLYEPPLPESTTLITAVLTMMFVPVDTRLKLLSDIYALLSDGGAFIMVEKMLGEGSAIDELLVGEYYRHKADMGYSNDDIERKRLSLQGVLVPSQPSTHIDNLKTLGFRHVDCFWRWMNFAGFIAVK